MKKVLFTITALIYLSACGGGEKHNHNDKHVHGEATHSHGEGEHSHSHNDHSHDHKHHQQEEFIVNDSTSTVEEPESH